MASATLSVDERPDLKIWKSVWFPLSFTLLYLKLASVVAQSKALNTSWVPVGAMFAIALLVPSVLLLWTFYGLSFLLRLRRWPVVLIMAGLLSPVVVAATFWFLVAVGKVLS
jgi:hypothetical protein